MNDKLYWVGFNLVKGIGAVRFQALLNAFGDAQTAWNASPSALTATGLGAKLVERLLEVRRSVDLVQYWEGMQRQGIRVLIPDEDEYPAQLKDIDQPPLVLYLRGEVTPEDGWAVAIVGTRAVTAYGRQVTEELAQVLAGSGVTVVSGLARGVDGVAHSTALEAGGRTLAVLGSGVDLIYPPEHRALAVVVVEAGETSGALITAGFAADQSRDVFAMPRNIHAPQSKGPNRLIRDGAHPLLQPQDVLEALDLTRNLERREIRRAAPSDATEAALPGVLEQQPPARGRDPLPDRPADREGLRSTDHDGTQGVGPPGRWHELRCRPRRAGRLRSINLWNIPTLQS